MKHLKIIFVLFCLICVAKSLITTDSDVSIIARAIVDVLSHMTEIENVVIYDETTPHLNDLVDEIGKMRNESKMVMHQVGNISRENFAKKFNENLGLP